MFHLTAQEKSVVAVFLTVICLGSCVHFALSKKIPAVRWVKRPISKPRLPNLNTATVVQLDKLPGVGPKTAQRIVEYRIAHGPFKTWEDLKKVKGLTKTTYLKIRQAYAHP
jgi:competence ComEA-like helix-hairpin-helix protein